MENAGKMTRKKEKWRDIVVMTMNLNGLKDVLEERDIRYIDLDYYFFNCIIV